MFADLCSHHPIWFQNFFITSKRNCTTHQLLSNFLQPLGPPYTPLICFPSLWIYLLWLFHTNEIIKYVILCIWLLSESMLFARFIHVIAHIRTSFLLWMSNIPLYGYTTFYLFTYQLMDMWVVFAFWLLWIILLWTFVCKLFISCVFIFLGWNCWIEW